MHAFRRSLRFDTPADGLLGVHCSWWRSGIAQARRATVLRMTGMPSAVSSARARAWMAGRRPSVSGLDGRSQAVGLGQARFHGGEFVGVQGLVGAHCDAVPPWAGLGHPCRRAAVSVSGNCQEGLLHRCRRPSSGDHGELVDNRQAPCCPSGGRLAEDLTSGCAPLSQSVEIGNAAGIQEGVVSLLHPFGARGSAEA
jgi:hypothetical protein